MNKLFSLSLFGLVSLLGLSETVFAAVPAAMSSAITGIETDALALLDLVIPVVAAIFGVMILIKLFKRAGNKV